MRRRDFLRFSLSSLASLGSYSCVLKSKSILPIFDVVIVGGGLSGLVSALRLKQSGRSVLVLEASPRLGGRVWTESLQDGSLFERGAMFFRDNQVRLVALHKELKVEFFPYDNTFEKEVVYFFDQSRLQHRWTEQKSLPFKGLKAHEKKSSLATLSFGDRSLAMDRIQTTLPPMSYADHMREVGHSNTAINIFDAFFGCKSSYWDASYIIGQQRVANFKECFVTRGGSEALIQSLAKLLSHEIRTSSPVLHITKQADFYNVTYKMGDAYENAMARWMILAVPPPLMRSLDIALPKPWSRALESIDAIEVTRHHFHPVDVEGSEGISLGKVMAVTDLKTKRMFRSISNSGGAIGIVVDSDASINSQTQGLLVKEARADIQHVFPKLRFKSNMTESVSWKSLPWQKGAFSAITPRLPNSYQILQSIDERLQLAGDFTTLQSGWREGALESAERCVERILRS